MRRPALAAFLAVLIATASCSSDLIDGLDGGEPNVATMRISTGTQTITISSAGTVTGGPLNMGIGSTLNISATFFTAEGAQDPNVTQASFQLNVTSTGSIVFQRNNVNPFAGTLTAAGAGSSQLLFSLYDLEGQAHEFGPFSVPTVVN